MSRMEELVKTLNEYAYHYYVLDNPIVADIEYDVLYDELKKLEEETHIVLDNSPTKRVGGEPIEEFEKHNHLNRLYSLDKANTYEELYEFDNRIKKAGFTDIEYTVEYKLDGLTINLTYDNGKFVRATTRGNGVTGEDVTSQVLTIKSFPLVIEDKSLMEIQGEGIMRLSVLKKYNETADVPLKNARNAVSGAIRNLNPKETEKRNLDILFYNINYGKDEIETQEEVIEFLKKNKFKVSPYLKKCKDIFSVIECLKEIEKERNDLDFLIDGAVVKVNNLKSSKSMGYTEKFPKGQLAFKFKANEITTILNDVIWQVGRTGKVTPLAMLEEVELGGVNVKKATLNNYDDILRKGVKINSRVLIRRSNDVIPEILGTYENYENSKEILPPTTCPSCNAELVKNGVNIFCLNHRNCITQIVKRISHFASKEAMNIDGLSEKTIIKFHTDLGVTDISDLYKLTFDELVNLESFKEKKANNILNAIEKSKTINFANFIYSLGIWGVGIKNAKALANNFESIGELENASLEKLVSVQDIGEIIAGNIREFFDDEYNKEVIDKLFEMGVSITYKKQNAGESTGIFAGETIVLTGTLNGYTRSEASKLIEENGGEIGSSITSKTTMVLAGENAGSKLEKARQKGIKIITEDEFIKYF